jgi:Membrane domain of glycerophosphoryl diester phosphodiesterase
MAMSDARPSSFDWGVGSAIGTAFSTLFSNFVPFVGLALLIGIPGLVLTFVGTPPWLNSLVGLVLGQVVTITLIYGTVQSLRGRNAGLSECLSQGLGRLPASIGVAILAGLGIVLGLILLVVPGLYLMTLWAVAIPSAVVERTGVGESFTRSSNLTDGRRWRVFGVLIVGAIVTNVIIMVIGAVMVAVLVGSGGTSMAALAPMFIVLWIVGAIMQAFMSCLSGVLYTFLRRDKEGADIESIAKVFD